MTALVLMAGVFGGLFGSGNANQNNPPTQTNNPAPVQQTKPATQTTNDPLKLQQPNPTNTTDPNNPNPTNNPPADIFANLWDNAPEDPNNPKPTNHVYGTVKLDQLMGAASKMDFTANIAPELLQAATGGDMNALIQIINQVGQQSYANALLGGMRVFDQGAEARFNSFNQELPAIIGQHTAFNQTRELSPLATNPSTKPVYDMVVKQIIAKNPNATQKEINDSVMQYVTMFQQMGNSGNPTTETPPNPDAKWADFFS